MLLVLILGTAVGAVAFAGVALAGSVSNNASRALGNEQTKWAITGAVELAKSDLYTKKIAVGAATSYTISGRTIAVTTADNSAVMPNTVKLTLSGSSNGRPVYSTQVIAMAKPVITTIWSHGVYSNNGFTWPASSSVAGSVYFRNSISVLATGGQVSQDFKTSSMFNPMGLIKVGGAILTGMKPYTWPTLNTTTYTGQAASVLTGNQTLSGYTFPKDNAIVVVNGNLNLTNAQITRSGTFYVTGTVTVDKLQKMNASDHVVVICPNGITFSNGNKPVIADGYFFSGSTISIGSPLTVTGALVANSFTGSSAINIIWDQWIMADPANGKTLMVPGL